MRNQISYEQNDQEDVYIAIEDEKVFDNGSIELYRNVLNRCVHNGTVNDFIKDYILKEYEGLKFIVKTRTEIRNFAESLQNQFDQWRASPEREETLNSLIRKRIRGYTVGLIITAALQFGLAYYVDKHDNIPGLGTPPDQFSNRLYYSGGGTLVGAIILQLFTPSRDQRFTLSCLENRLSRNLDKEYVYSIFSSKRFLRIRDDKEFKGFLNSEAGKIDDLEKMVTSYLLG